MAVTLGTSIHRYDLVCSGLLTGLLSLLKCIFVGGVIGLIYAGVPGDAVQEAWPTHEMASRGDQSGLLVGFVIALASGIGTYRY